MAKQTVQGKVTVITGSSMGIGKATAKLLASHGAKVIINGRTASRLEQTKQEFEQEGWDVLSVVADISTQEGAAVLINKAVDHYGKIDVLINNAGMSARGYFEEIDPEVLERMLRINVMGCLHPTKVALPYLESTRGSIVFVSSVAGIRGLPETGIYCATKMALTAVAESLKIELSDKGIHVGIVYVGITENDPGKRVIDKDGSYLVLKDRQQRTTQKPDDVARAIVRMIEKRQFKKILTMLGKLNAIANVLFPRLVDRVLIRSKERIRRLNT